MDDGKLFERLRYPLPQDDLQLMVDFFLSRPNGIAELIDICATAEKSVGFHAAWVLDHLFERRPELLTDWIFTIIGKMPGVSNLSVRRHFARIVNLTLGKNGSRDVFLSKKHSHDVELLAEVCFGWLLDSKTPVAVKAHCMDILMYFAPTNSWVKEELPNVIRLLMIDATPGVASKSKKVLNQLASYDAN